MRFQLPDRKGTLSIAVPIDERWTGKPQRYRRIAFLRPPPKTDARGTPFVFDCNLQNETEVAVKLTRNGFGCSVSSSSRPAPSGSKGRRAAFGSKARQEMTNRLLRNSRLCSAGGHSKATSHWTIWIERIESAAKDDASVSRLALASGLNILASMRLMLW